jgi:hypothetical protein
MIYSALVSKQSNYIDVIIFYSTVTDQWVSDCCLMPTRQYRGENKLIFKKMTMRSPLY